VKIALVPDDVPHTADRVARAHASDAIVVDSAEPLPLARRWMREVGTDERERPIVVRWAGQWWRWQDGHHRALDDEALRAELWRFLDRVEVETIDDEGNATCRPLAPTSRRVSEVADALIAVAPNVSATATLPQPLTGYIGPEPRHVAIVRNGRIDLGSGELHEPSPLLFATAGAAVDYDVAAVCPAWVAFLEQIFTDPDCGDDGVDRESIRLARQIFGWMIAGDTTRHKIPLFVGPARSGKSTMMAILRALLGDGNVCAPPLSTLAESRFGLAPLLGKSAAIIPDARLGSKADQATVAGLLLAASGQDVISIDRKGRDAIEARLRCRIVIVTNELPRIGDSSGALTGRFLIVETRRSFQGREDLGLEARLRTELPGVLRWALDGWRDLETNGWALPASSRQTLEELVRLGSPIQAFIDDRLVLDAAHETAIDVLYIEWQKWCTDNGRKEPGNKQTFARDLRAALPAVRVVRRGNQERVRMYAGLGVRVPT
jgi:putative DNA primase/helicase